MTSGEALEADRLVLITASTAKYALYGSATMLYDPYKATQMAVRAQQENINTIEFRQGYISMSEPCQEFERLVLSGGLEHDGNPIMTWMVGNMVKTTNSTGLIKADRGKSAEKIDGGIAAIMSIGEYMLPSEAAVKVIPAGYVSPMDRE